MKIAALAAAGVTLLAIGSAVADPLTYEGPCVLTTTTVTCTGSQAADGVYVGDVGVTQLDVNTITGDIQPANGIGGVVFDTTSAAAANLQLGSFAIKALGEGADGVYISAYGDNTAAQLTLVGAVNSGSGRGVVVTGSGAVTSNTTGAIDSLDDALTAKSWGGAVEVDHSSTLTSREGRGLYVEGLGSDINIQGNIDSLGDAVYSHSWGDGLTNVVINGSVTAREGSGVVVEEDNDTAGVNVTGKIAAHVDGISVTAVDAVTVVHSGVLTTDTGTGIYAKSSDGGVDITQKDGALTSHGDAIVAEAHGDAGVTVNSTSITADEGRGVVATATTGNIDLNLKGVTAKQVAIWAEAGGSGNVDIDVDGDVLSNAGKGIYATSADSTVKVVVHGSVTSKLDAIYAEAADGTVTVNTGNVVSYDGKGAFATAANDSVDLTFGTVTSKLDAIYGNSDNGNVTVHASDIVSYDGKGVSATAANGTIGLTLGGVTTKLDAISAQSQNGAVTIDANDVTSYSGKGIHAETKEGLVDVSVGAVTSQQDAIYAHTDDGPVTIDADDVVSYGGAGVYATTSADLVGLTLGSVTSQLDAIYAQSNDGSVTVGADDVTSYDGKGIHAQTDEGPVSITVGAVTSQQDAIYAQSDNGAVTVTADDVVSYAGKGIHAENDEGLVNISVGAVTSEQDAIYAHADDGLVSVNATGDVTSYSGAGVFATGDNNAVGLTLAGVTSKLDAIYAKSNNGAVTITAGDINSYDGKGVHAESDEGLVNVSVGGVTSKLDAIYAHADDGLVTVDATGDVVSYDGAGVFATSDNNAVGMTLRGTTSKLDAIHAEAGGTVTLNTDDVVSYDGKGVYAKSAGSTVDLTLGSVTSKLDAIDAESNAGTTVRAKDVVSYDGAGVSATTAGGASNVYVDNVTSKLDAINATGTSSMVVTAKEIVSYDGKGVYAKTAGGTVGVTVGGVTSKLDAIFAEGTGGVTVGADDVVSYDGLGIHAVTVGGSVSVTAGGVTSELDAIYAVAPNSLSITAGDVVSYAGAGVYGKTLGSTETTVSLGGVSSKLDAIYVDAVSSVTITATGAVISKAGIGVVAKAKFGAASITTGDVTSENDAVFAQAGSGTANVNVGAVESKNGFGIYATATGGNADETNGVATVSSKGVTSKNDAITAISDIGYATVDTAGGNVRSYTGTGIVAKGGNGLASIAAGDVAANKDAVYAEAHGSGTATVNVGDVTSDLGKGVVATTEKSAVSVTTHDVTSKLDAIYAVSGNNNVTVNAGKVVSYEGRAVYATTISGLVSVTVNGASSKLDAITAQSSNGVPGTVTVTSTGSVNSDTGKAIIANAVSGAVTVTVDSNNVNVASNVTSKLDAITAQANNGAVSVTVAGNVNSDAGKAIDASSLNGAVTVVVGDDSPARTGSVTAKQDAITAVAKSGVTSVGVTGDVTSYDGKAVYATSDTAAVTVTVGGDVVAKQDAIIAQSNSGSATDLVKVDLLGDVTSYDGKGIQATSANGRVTVDVDGDVTTQGDAITAGTTGSGTTSTLTVTTGGDITSYSGRGIVANAANRAATVASTGAVTTELTGIYARSTGGDAYAIVDITQTGHLISWKGIGIDALSTGGPVTVLTSSGIEADLDAVVATSQGGDTVGTVSVTNTSGKIVSHKGTGIVASSARDHVTVHNTADIDADQNGISATSTGDTETSGVTVEQTGNITVAKGSGIHAESVADGSIILDGDIKGGIYGIDATSLSGAVEASIAEGNEISGSSAAGVYLNAYTTAKLTNRGDLSSDSGLAFEFDGEGAGTVDNYGTISGNFVFDVGAGTFNNLANAIYNAGDSMNFAGGGTFDNAGLLSMTTNETDSVLENTYLSGNFAQTETGTMRTDIRFSDNWSDRLVVSGTADFAGKVSVNVSGDLYGGGLVKDFKILTADAGLTLGDVTVTNPTLHASVVEENDTDAILKIDGIDLGPDGMDATYSSLGDYLENVFDAGAPDDLKPLFAALLSIPDLGSYEDALAQLTPEEYVQDLLSTSGNNLGFTNRLLSCRVAEGANRFKAEGDCDWAGGRLATLGQDESGHMTAYNATYASLEAGTQRRIDANWRLGGAVGITNSSTSGADGSTVQATQGQAGVVVKYDADALLLASAITAGYGEHQIVRTVNIGGIDETLTGDGGVAYASARLNGSYTFDFGATYIKPLFNLDLTATRFGGVTETGGGTALTIDPGTLYAATFNPAIEIGGEFADGTGNLIRPFVQLGLEASLVSDLDLQARFSNVDPSVGSFTIGQPRNEPAVKVSVGADVLTQDKSTVRVYYDGSFSATSRKNSLGLKLSHNF